MIRAIIICAAVIAIEFFARQVGAATRQLSCTGVAIEPTRFALTSLTARLTLGNAHSVGVDLARGSINARIVSNNKIQLRFTTKNLVGEYFHYSGDLFLIHRSGHLDRLICSAS
jgi:hypothetical protein